MRSLAALASRSLAAAALGGVLAALSEPVAAEAMRDVTFIVVNNLFSTPAFVAVEKGYWVAQGLNVKLKLTASGRQVTQALQAGEAQFGHASLSTTTASARASGNLIKGVMPYFNAAEYVALGGRAIIGRRDRGIDPADPRTLVGKKIAHLTGSTNEVYMRQWFNRHGLDIGQSQLVSVPVEDMPITIRQGLVDAVVPWEPYTAQAIRELGSNAAIVSRSEPGLVTDVIGVVANEDWIKRNYDLLEKFSIGIAEAARFIRQDPKAAAEIDTLYLDGLNVADATEGLSFLRWDPRLSVCTEYGVARAGNDMIKEGLIKRAKPFEPTEFYDKTVLDRVMASHGELFSDLPPLPEKLADCKGQLPG
jgi:ABC-type nitrate/sulfonate/bicarbonate transport system substrate-binding protein